MTGGLIQIVAYGAADVFLTGMPQITFFKIVYRRYTNFAIENIEQTFSGTKVASGVYLIYCASASGDKSATTKLLVVN